MAPTKRRPRPVLRIRHSFEPSRLQEQLLAMVYRLVNEAAHAPPDPDRTAEHPARRRSAPGEHGTALPRGQHHG
jgi:hypothetical protein